MNNVMKMSSIAQLILAVGTEATVMVRGQPGIGKSSLLHALAEARPDYLPVTIDCANLQLGDLGMPVVNKELMRTSFAPTSLLKLDSDRPLLLLLDELSKCASAAELNMLLPVVLERRFAEYPLPAGSIVLATGNSEDDGVGDLFPAHVCSRVVNVEMRNPTADEWVDNYAMPNGLTAEIMKFSREHPEVFDHYRDAPDNKDIYNPKKGNTRMYCCPRTLAKADVIVRNRGLIEDYVAALVGTIGIGAATKLQGFIDYADKMPRVSAIIADPLGARLPNDGAAYAFMAQKLASSAALNNFLPIAQYVTRWEQEEAVVMFTHSLAVRTGGATGAKCGLIMSLLTADATGTLRNLTTRCGRTY